MLNDPLLSIEVSPRNVAANTVKQWVVTVDKKRKFSELFVHLLRKSKWKQVLVAFAPRPATVSTRLVEKLQGPGYQCRRPSTATTPQATRQRSAGPFQGQ